MVEPRRSCQPVFANDLAIQMQRGAGLLPRLERDVGPDRVHNGSTSSKPTTAAYRDLLMDVSRTIGRYSAGACAPRPASAGFSSFSRSPPSTRCTDTKNT